MVSDEAYAKVLLAASSLALTLEYYDKNPADENSYTQLHECFEVWDSALSSWINTLSEDERASAKIAKYAHLDISLVDRVLKAAARYVEGYSNEQ